MGGVIFPIMVSRLIAGIGFPWAMRATALLILVVLTTTNLTVKSRILLNPSPFSVKEYLVPFKEISFFLTAFGNILFAFGSFVPMTYLVAQATSEGMEKRLAQYLIAMLHGARYVIDHRITRNKLVLTRKCSIPSRIAAGIVADKTGPFNVWITVTYSVGALLLALWIPATGNAAIIVFAIIFGSFFGAYATIQPVLVAQISPIKDIGIRTGLYFAVSSCAQLVSGPIAGAVLSASGGSYLGMKILAGLFCLAGATLVFGAKLYATGFKPMAKF